MAMLFALSIVPIYRSRFIPPLKRHNNDVVRYIVSWCLLLQFLTFLGYYIGYVPLMATVWNFWIPSWTAGYVLLSHNIAMLYSARDHAHPIANPKKQTLKWLLLWGGCSVSEWTASICGWLLNFHDVQAIGYLLWKVIAFIMLVMLARMLYEGKQDIQGLLNELDEVEHTNNGKRKSINIAEIANIYTKMRMLMTIEMILALYLFIAVVYETYVIVSIFQGRVVNSIYVTQATFIKMVVYFPLWSLINTVLLVYGWVPKRMMDGDTVEMSVDTYRRGKESERSTNAVESTRDSIINISQ
eukprot:300844_1